MVVHICDYRWIPWELGQKLIVSFSEHVLFRQGGARFRVSDRLTFEAGSYGTLDGRFGKLATPGTNLVLLAGDGRPWYFFLFI